MRSVIPVAFAAATLLAHGAWAQAQDGAPATPSSEPAAPASSPAAPPSSPAPSSAPGAATTAAPAPESAPAAAPTAASPPRPAEALAPKPVGRAPAPQPAAAARTPELAPAVAAAAHVAGARLQPGQPLPPGELAAFVDGAVRDAMRRQHVAGVTVAVVQNGQLLLKKGYGFASLTPERPVDPDRTLFRLGSVSKSFTWIGVLKQVEAGRIRLDQPVNLYLPEHVRVRDQGFDQPVRVVDLMDHAAGFEDRGLGHAFEQDPEYVRPLDLYLRQERPRRVRAPGEISSYSDYGAGLAGEAAAYVAGKPFERLMEEQIFLPLGMSHTTFRERRPVKAGLPAPMPAALAPDVAEGFRWTGGGFEPRPYAYMGQNAPAASASSTASDMARYMLALLGGGQWGGATLYGPRTAKALRTPILATPAGVNGWAHGFAVEQLPGDRTGYGHEGDTLSFAAKLILVPELNLGIFVAANSDTGAHLVEDLPREVVGEFYSAPQAFPRDGSAGLVQEAVRYDGRYLTTRRAYSGLEGFVDRLLGASWAHVTPQGVLVTTGAFGPRAWVADGDPAEGRFIARQGDERLVFQLTDGEASAYRSGLNTALYERISFWRSPDALALLTALAMAAAALSLMGAALRNRREVRQSAVQARAALVQNIQGGLWLAAFGAFGVWAVRSLGDPAKVVFDWPGALLITASTCALAAAILTMATLFALPAVWRGGRRVDSWPILRRAAYTVTTLIYATLSVLLAQAGGLNPLSG